jgi:flagellar biosynthetic protein FliR
MDEWIAILLPFALLLGRVSGFFAVAPFFSWAVAPVRARAGMTLVVTVFLAMISTVQIDPQGVHWIRAGVLIAQEILCGAGLGLAARLVYQGIQQGAQILGRQMGMLMANVVDPTSRQRSQPISIFFDMGLMMLFLAIGGHHLLVYLLVGSYKVLPAGGAVDLAAVSDGVVAAGSTMLLLALKLAAPALAGFMVLGVLLGILARVLPEMNILLASFPLRVGLGLFIAAASFPLLDGFASDIAEWIGRLLTL